jgi:hypothetical protein
MIALLLFQVAVLAAVLLLWSSKAATLCLASISIAWGAALTLVSAHLQAGGHLLWIVPAAWVPVLFWQRRRRVTQKGRAEAV